jgi:hypothetical protein
VALDQPSVEQVARRLRILIDADEQVNRSITLPKLPSLDRN